MEVLELSNGLRGSSITRGVVVGAWGQACPQVDDEGYDITSAGALAISKDSEYTYK